MNKSIILFISILLAFVLGVATAKTATDENKKARVDVFKFGDMVDITVLPANGYKWNKDFPATLKFSVCNEQECIFITEKIKIKKQ